MSAILRKAIDAVNYANRHSLNSRSYRLGQNSLLATLLHHANAYAGFGYLTADQVPVGQKPGIIRDESEAKNHNYPDDSRVFYYVHGKLIGRDAQSAAIPPATITPTPFEKSQWSRMAQAAYRDGHNLVGHQYSIAASLPSAGSMATPRFDDLQRGFREWLLSNAFPTAAAAE
jgi:hypothetical protein